MAYCRKCGALIDDYAAVCPKCGTPQNGGPNNPPPAADNGGFLWGLLGCCIPIAGLILFLIWKDTKPRTAKAAGIGALVCVIAYVLRRRLWASAQRCMPIKLRRWLWRWLPILFGCHCRPDRSFHFRDGTPFPICARCTGELAGILAGLATWWAVHPSAGVAAVLLVPLIADGLLQLCTPYESGNLRRLATGLLFGYGLTVLLLTSLGWAYQWGFGFGKALLDP